MYWNRESLTRSIFDAVAAPIVQSARIISVSDIQDPANDALHRLGSNSTKEDKDNSVQLVAVGGNGGIQDFDLEALKLVQPNVIFISHPTRVSGCWMDPSISISIYIYMLNTNNNKNNIFFY